MLQFSEASSWGGKLATFNQQRSTTLSTQKTMLKFES